MSNQIQVRTSQGIQPAEIVSENKLTVWVRLPDGRVIQRSKKKHVVTGEEAAA